MSLIRENSGWVARCRFRDLDGVTRRVERRGSSRTAAHARLLGSFAGAAYLDEFVRAGGTAPQTPSRSSSR